MQDPGFSLTPSPGFSRTFDMAVQGTKFIFVTGGVVSSVGKGLTAAAIGALLEDRRLVVTLIKMDPYLNLDPGTMNPFQHGEVFVTEDGAETDLDLGHYERFTTVRLTRHHNITTGKVYKSVIDKERAGKYLGKTVQIIPHITDEIKRQILRASEGVDVSIVEVGGTVGDIESLPFLEAIRQMRVELGHQNSLSMHVTYVPWIAPAEELKTKPTQHSVKALREIGIQPDVLICRSDRTVEKEHREKIGLFCNLPPEAVINAVDVESVYQVPRLLKRQGLDKLIADGLNIWSRASRLAKWKKIEDVLASPESEVDVAIVGKYVHLKDSYKSLHEALVHGGIANRCQVNVRYVDSEEIEEKGSGVLEGVHAILVPGGFGDRGIEGKVLAAQYARQSGIPYFGICLGMQIAVIEFARNVLGLGAANSSEFSPHTPDPVIHMMEAQRDVSEKGGTMRLGAYGCQVRVGSLAHKIYNAKSVEERHRHRFEFNNEYRDRFEQAGMSMCGINTDLDLVEMIEVADHPHFIACQFHPEFKSRPLRPHPLFDHFVRAALGYAGAHSERGPVEDDLEDEED
jgi:CTP synthase